MIYEGTITHLATDNNGNQKTVRESFLFENYELFGQVETYFYSDNNNEELDVTAIKRSRVKEIANKRTFDSERIFIATLVETFTNEDGSEKEIKYQIALFANDIEGAHAFVREYIKQGYGAELKQLKETKFKEVIK